MELEQIEWAASLDVGDKYYGNIRHKTCDEKSIINTALTVVDNYPEKGFIMATMDEYDGAALVRVPYNELI